MSFRGRLRLFFALIVIVPMVALGIVLFTLTERTETGKADAGIATATRAAVGVYREEVVRARAALRGVARDPELQRAIARGSDRAARSRMSELVRGEVVAIELWAPGGERRAGAGSPAAVATAGSEIVAGGAGPAPVLTASATEAQTLARRVAVLTGLEVTVLRSGRPLASTLPATGGSLPRLGERPTTFHVAGEEYRGRIANVSAPAGPPVQLGVLTPTASFSQHVSDNRLLITLFLGVSCCWRSPPRRM